MEASTVVIKVKYGDILRRFNAKVVDGELDLRIGGLTEKILSLFNFTPDSEIMLTYIDEDGDSVALVDDDDLCDVVKQSLNPVRISVKLDNENNGTLFSLSTRTSNPSRSPRVKQTVKPDVSKLSSLFIQDLDRLRSTAIAPLTPFTKIWRMRNNGTVVWPQKAQLVWFVGEKLGNLLSLEIESQIPATGVAVGHMLDVAVDFIAPALPGWYMSYWRMASPSGEKFGDFLRVVIQVKYVTLKEAPRVGVQGLNPNLQPPLKSGLNGPEISNAGLTPLVEDSRPEPDNSNKMVEIVDPVFHMPMPNNEEQEMKFPIIDNSSCLLVGNGASSSALPALLPSESYPIIDTAPPAFSTPGKEQVENILPRELAEMGFKQVDLNKEVLGMNEYDLCGVADWDHILDELLEMGFHDTDMNKKLLKKNNGSIKRVVMDLIAGEEKQ